MIVIGLILLAAAGSGIIWRWEVTWAIGLALARLASRRRRRARARRIVAAYIAARGEA
jgi:hypothetical protein